MGRQGRRRRGLRPEPEEGWPLDRMLVGVATLRTMRELFLQDVEFSRTPRRAWDLALYNGVTPQGSAESLLRLAGEGLARGVPPEDPRRAMGYRLEPGHSLADPLRRLFRAESRVCRRHVVRHDLRAAMERRARIRPGPSVVPVR